MAKQLLPVGFYDLLFDEAEKNRKNVNTALDVFLENKYRLVKTPLVEFEDNFEASEIGNSFRAIDVISGKNVVFRNDVTLQISRLVATRLKQEQLPLKLCYSGDVLCAKSADLHADRQQTQAGIEIIGTDCEKSEIEVISVLLAALNKLDAKDLLIEFSLPDFLDIFLAEIGEENSIELRAAIMQKNLTAIKDLAKNNSEIIAKIAFLNSDLAGLAKETLAKTNSTKIVEQLNKAQKIAEFLQQKFAGISTRFDLFGDHSASYHSGVSFDVFCGDFSYPIACGGRYKINTTDAVGATIYMNRLLKTKL